MILQCPIYDSGGFGWFLIDSFKYFLKRRDIREYKAFGKKFKIVQKEMLKASVVIITILFPVAS